MGLYTVIITAGGIGKRMNSDLPKQFIEINEKPILMHTLEQMYHFNPRFQIVLTLPEAWRLYWEELIITHDFRIPHRIVDGGKERYHSIKNALEHCSGDYVIVHDGVRPLVGHETLNRCLEALKLNDAVIPVVELKESLRVKSGTGTTSVDRSMYQIVQTPQCFRKEVLISAYSLPFHDGITDDASLVEAAGFKVKTVEGNEKNIKITRNIDLKFAELFLK
ncbi:MAG: 2-C-methyl-D-erythritol 4-phosphate cytidylyltransferase [Crocinitomicaceae bacterium]|nr:2-C-methyl-D-erythritol 4-phosphate cytidylyltransferase [Crocinitomicaceae bacterium]MDG1777166.1 2-C-methyl-D-erythritol 4-phosphate cytidylyltransferase [Crocinitomicaceae bacterium]